MEGGRKKEHRQEEEEEEEEEERKLHSHFTEMNRLENFLCNFSVGFLSSSFQI